MSKIAINLTKCPKCGTLYHWGTRGWGNCPTCAKGQSSNKNAEFLTKGE